MAMKLDLGPAVTQQLSLYVSETADLSLSQLIVHNSDC